MIAMVLPFPFVETAPCGLDGDRSCDEALPEWGRVIPNPAGARSCTSGKRGSERGNAVVRLHPHPAEWRIGSPLIEAAWYDAAHPERNNGVGHGNPKRGNAGTIVFVACPDMASPTERRESTNRLSSSFAAGKAFGEDWGTSKDLPHPWSASIRVQGHSLAGSIG